MTDRTPTAVPLTSEQKQVIIAEHGRGPHAAVDTGSSEVQIAMVNKRIRDITEHLKFHKHDHHSRRGLLLLVGRQRRMLNHLADTDVARYRTIIATLGIRNTLKR